MIGPNFTVRDHRSTSTCTVVQLKVKTHITRVLHNVGQVRVLAPGWLDQMNSPPRGRTQCAVGRPHTRACTSIFMHTSVIVTESRSFVRSVINCITVVFWPVDACEAACGCYMIVHIHLHAHVHISRVSCVWHFTCTLS